jgi:CO dehydrogenase maturation factor
MSQIIAFAGKGGTGKTTTASLFINSIIKSGTSPLLAIDADPNSNLGEALGCKVELTIGAAREEIFTERSKMPSGVPKEAFIDLKLNQTLIEEKDFDLMVMGRQEGSGCYCALNNILRHFIEKVTDNYPVTIIDNEAGMEHLARRTTANIDSLIIVSDYSIKGLRAAARILELVSEIKITVHKPYLLVTRAPDTVDPVFQAKIDEIGIEFLGFIPADEDVQQFDLHQKSFLDIPETSPALQAVGEMVKKVVS